MILITKKQTLLVGSITSSTFVSWIYIAYRTYTYY